MTHSFCRIFATFLVLEWGKLCNERNKKNLTKCIETNFMAIEFQRNYMIVFVFLQKYKIQNVCEHQSLCEVKNPCLEYIV